VLGYLDPDFPLGGTVHLNKPAAEKAIADLGEKVGLSPLELAAGILQISNSQMADLARKVTIERGLDPRSFTLFGYGGAGPVFSGLLMRELGSHSAYVPADSGVFSAFGMLTTDIAFQEERSTTLRSPLSAKNVQAINTLYDELTERVLSRFKLTGLDTSEVGLQRAVDMRFGMQVHELDVDAPLKKLTLDDLEQITQDFIAKYEATYGADSAYAAAGIEFVTFRVTGTLAMERPSLTASQANGDRQGSRIGRKPAYFSPQGLIDTDFHSGDRLVPGQMLSGPAIVQRSGDTVVLPPRMTATVDNHGGLTIVQEAS